MWPKEPKLFIYELYTEKCVDFSTKPLPTEDRSLCYEHIAQCLDSVCSINGFSN